MHMGDKILLSKLLRKLLVETLLEPLEPSKSVSAKQESQPTKLE